MLLHLLVCKGYVTRRRQHKIRAASELLYRPCDVVGNELRTVFFNHNAFYGSKMARPQNCGCGRSANVCTIEANMCSELRYQLSVTVNLVKFLLQVHLLFILIFSLFSSCYHPSPSHSLSFFFYLLLIHHSIRLPLHLI